MTALDLIPNSRESTLKSSVSSLMLLYYMTWSRPHSHWSPAPFKLCYHWVRAALSYV